MHTDVEAVQGSNVEIIPYRWEHVKVRAAVAPPTAGWAGGLTRLPQLNLDFRKDQIF
jgi:hypothetical protein